MTPFSADPSLVLPAEIDRLLLAHCSRRNLVSHEAVFARGVQPATMFKVTSGNLQVTSIGSRGDELTLATLRPGDWFGEVPLIDNLPRYYEVNACCQSEVAVLPGNALWRVAQSNPEVWPALCQLVCRKLRSALSWIEGSALSPLPIRLANLIIRLAADSQGEIPVINLSQGELAKRLGVSRQTVNNQLRIWEKSGYLELRYRGVYLTDPDSLAQLMSDPKPSNQIGQLYGKT